MRYTINEGIQKEQKFRKYIVAGVVGLLMVLAVSSQAFAAQNAIGAGFSSAPPGTVGPGISGDLYGNTSNPSGNGNGVTPSFSPGPWVCGNPSDCAGPTDPGGSMGDFVSPIASGGQSQSEFANGNDQDIDFSAH
jgi:hypothetical protein